MGLNIGGPLNSGLVSITNKGITSNTTYNSTASFTVVSSSAETIYAYDKDTRLITADISRSLQTQSILWINDGTGGDGRLRWDLLDNAYQSYIDGYGVVTRYKLHGESGGHDNIGTPTSNNTYGTADSYIFNIYPYSDITASYVQYNTYIYNATHSIEIHGFNTASLNTSSFESIIFTVPGTGSYAFATSLLDISYTGTTCSISFRESQRYLFGGISDYATSSFTPGDKFYNGHILFLSSSVFVTSSVEGTLIKPPITSVEVYFDSIGYFLQLAGDQRNYFKPGTTIDIAGFSVLVNGSTYDTESGEYLTSPGSVPILGDKTRVYTMTYPFTGNVYSPFTVSTGVNSHVLGFGGVSTVGPQVVIGTYNKNSNYNSLFVIGNGTSNSNRSDILSVTRNAVNITGSLNVSGSISGSLTGSLIGTASWATQAVSSSTVAISSTNTNGTYYLHFGNQTSGHDNIEVDTNLTYNPSTNQLTTTGITGSLFGTSSWAQSSSQALTASYVNPLNQTVIISGSIILSSSAPPAVAGGIYFDGTDFYLGF